MATIQSIAAGPTGTSKAVSYVRKSGPCRSILCSSASSSMLSAQDRIAIALEAVGQLEEESRQLERQWTLRRERARYEAERAWRQYDAVEPENRLVARSLERAWEEKLRAVEVIEQEHAALAVGGTARDRRRGPRKAASPRREPAPNWHAATTSAADRKRILRFIVREVALDQKRAPGQVCLKIVWQTGATSEHRLQRRVHTYRDYIDLERLRQRIAELNGARKMDGEIAAILNQEGFVAARGPAPSREKRMSGCCAPAGVFRPRRSTASAQIRCAGPTEASRSRAQLLHSRLPHKPYSIIWHVDCWQATS